MAQVADRWHLSKPGNCPEHKGKTPSAVHGDGMRWQVRYRDPGGVQRKENFERRSDADRRRNAVETDMTNGSYAGVDLSRVHFRDYAEAWRKAQPHRPNTSRSAESALRLYAYPAFGFRRLATIKPSEVQSWALSLVQVKGLGAGTAHVVLSKLSGVFTAAVRDGVIARNPCQYVRLPTERRPELTPLSGDEVMRLARAMPPQYYALVVLAAGSGMRPGELFGLQVRNVDGGMVHVDHQVQGGAPCPPKTGHSYRSIPIPRIAANALADHMQFMMPYSPTPADGDFLWPVTRTSFSRAWHVALKRAKLPEGTRLHDLRHTYASALIAGGAGPKTVAARLGDTVAVAMGTYAHLFPSAEDETRDSVEDFLCALDVP